MLRGPGGSKSENCAPDLERTEKQARENEFRYNLLEQASNGVLWTWDVDIDKVQWNEAFERIFGYSPTPSYDAGWTIDQVHDEDRQRVYENIQAVMAGSGEHWTDEYRFRRADGTYADVLARGYTVRNPQGQVTRMVGCMLDISAYRSTERALRESEQHCWRILEQSPIGIYRTAPDGQILLANSTLLSMLGYESFEELDTWNPEQGNEPFRRARAQFKARIDQEGEVRGYVSEWQKKDGSRITVREVARKVNDASGTLLYYEGMAEDITEQKRLEEHLRQVQKMEVIGRLAGGIAHDFNNLLTIILGHSQVVLLQMDKNDPLRASIEDIQTAGQRAANLTSQLLAFSRKQILKPEMLDLNNTIKNVSAMLHRLLGADIDLSLHLEDQLGTVEADPAQLEQVLFNLAINARDAMPTGGKLIMETRNCDLDPHSAEIHGVRPGRYVMLTVSDTGCGMDEATRAAAFEPFFTTKESGKGTGLGLAMVLGVIEQSGGHIILESEAGLGSTFKIYLPRRDQPADEVHKIQQPAMLHTGEGSILLAEDDDLIRRLTSMVLREAGYTVWEAANGREALEAAAGLPHPPDLLLTDVMMPEMNGPDLAQALMIQWPRLQVIYTSGHTDHVLLSRGVIPGGIPFLQKPYTPDSLLRLVATVQASNRAPGCAEA